MMLMKHGSSNKTLKKLNTTYSSFVEKSVIGNPEKNKKEDKEKSRNKYARKEKGEKRKRRREMLTHHFTQAWPQNMTMKTMMMRDSLDRSQN